MAAAGYWYIAAADFRPLSRIFPRVVAGIVFVSALILTVLTLLGRGPVIRLSDGDAGERHMRSGTLMGALVLWTALIPLAGLLGASVVGVVIMGFITFRGHRGTGRAIAIALASVVVFYLLFQLVLHVPFPLGLFG
jgi:heme A synthase